jgi:hypothetical protein
MPWQGIDRKTDYTGEQLVGLDSILYIKAYFTDRVLDLSWFVPNDRRVEDGDGRRGRQRPKLMERGTVEFLVYHPNPAAVGHSARLDVTKTARLRIDLRDSPGRFRAEWYRAFDGVSLAGGTVDGSAVRELAAPWTGQDVVLRLLEESAK